ncbi:hypothetical protein GCM10010967_08840 [Dyadobacter beijingensis]|uniref:Uncharacterized protein n=1 Tax=Dyadobacter beijingensis TaxID=365489 RepID=A0ABQ2HIF9_9BACT|nr:hypothetical protein GCM10010967_08840 [Dyadobacter beijingensis]
MDGKHYAKLHPGCPFSDSRVFSFASKYFIISKTQPWYTFNAPEVNESSQISPCHVKKLFQNRFSEPLEA